MQNSERGILSLIFFFLVSLSLLGPQSAQASEVLVQTISGKLLRGQYVEETDSILVIETETDQITIPFSQITDFKILTKPESIFKQKRMKIEDDDYEARYDLAYEMFVHDQYEIASKELKKILKLQPENTQCKNLLKYIEKHQAEEKLAMEKAQEKDIASKAKKKTDKQVKKEDRFPHLITEEDVWLIRLWELPSNVVKSKCQVRVPKTHIDRLFQKYSADNRIPLGKKARYKFKGKKGYEQLDLIFKLNARELYRGIVVKEDPKPLFFFRRKFNPSYITHYFTKFFDKANVPGLELFKKQTSSARESYTNFLILNQLDYQGKPFINRDKPELSLILQWGLPRSDAKYPAPRFHKNWKPYYKGSTDPRYKDAVKWIKSLYQALPDPSYGIKYTVPSLREQHSQTVDKPKTDSK